MRIIAGEFRGRTLLGPPDRATRPMLNRVREALFSTLGDCVQEARVLDLFAGTGSLGLEALSRGAQAVHFLERDRRAVQRGLENVGTLKVQDRVQWTKGDALASIHWQVMQDQPDLVFMDPPYPFIRTRQGRAQLLECVKSLLAEHMHSDGILVLHTHPRDLRGEELLMLCGGTAPEPRVYGNTALWYLHAGCDS